MLENVYAVQQSGSLGRTRSHLHITASVLSPLEMETISDYYANHENELLRVLEMEQVTIQTLLNNSA